MMKEIMMEMMMMMMQMMTCLRMRMRIQLRCSRLLFLQQHLHSRHALFFHRFSYLKRVFDQPQDHVDQIVS